MIGFDFGRSFATFTTTGRENNARIQIEAVCDLLGAEREERYVLVASCKAEDTYGPGPLFRRPNYDFCAIFSAEEYLIVRVGLPLTGCWRDSGRITDRFAGVRITLAEAPARLCADTCEVVEATLADEPLVGRTELLGEDGAPLARLTYPIKTMNVNDERWVYQIDTGPVLLPDLDRSAAGAPAARAIEHLNLAFIAWSNLVEGAEFIVQGPVPIAHSDVCVGHYAGVRHVGAHNEVLVLD